MSGKDCNTNEILACRSPPYTLDEMFNLKNELLNRDNSLKPFSELKKSLNELGYEFRTADLSKNFKSAKAYVFFEMPRKQEREYYNSITTDNKYLLLLEPPATRKDNYDRKNHEGFSKILTWNDELVNGKKYLKINFPMPYREEEEIIISKKPFDSRKMLCMVSANKYSPHKDHLYTARVEFAKWAEKNHLDEFDLYGQRWDLPVFYSNTLERIGVNNLSKGLNKLKIKIPTNIFFKSNKGAIPNKKEIMSKYKFSICFENQTNINGYITEKIFDSFFSGCIPIYFGASNVEKYIPKDCFVDMRDFENYSTAYEYIESIEKEEFENKISMIEQYLNSKNSSQFKIDYFIKQFEKMFEIEQRREKEGKA